MIKVRLDLTTRLGLLASKKIRDTTSDISDTIRVILRVNFGMIQVLLVKMN